MTDKKQPTFTQDDRIEAQLILLGDMLKNRHALMRQARQDAAQHNTPPITAEAFDLADEMVMMAFRELCIAAEWQPELYEWRKQRSSLSDEFHYRELLKTLPPTEFSRLVLGEWVEPDVDHD